MTGEPISLTALRATLNSEVYSGSSLYPDKASRMPTWIRTDDVLALIDAIEAARALVEHWAQQGPTRRTLDLNPNSLRGREDALSEALARFTP